MHIIWSKTLLIIVFSESGKWNIFIRKCNLESRRPIIKTEFELVHASRTT